MNKLYRIMPKKLSKWVYLHKNKPMIMNWSDKEREKALAAKYKREMGREVDFNNPRLFTEKLQWYKLYFDHPDLSRIVCKYEFKSYIKEKLGEGHTVPLIGAWTSVEDIPWKDLPDTFVFKSNCQSDGRCIKFIKGKAHYNFEELKAELNEWLDPRKTLVNSFCRAYYGVTPMIIAEEYLENVADQLYDYKLFCFDGQITMIYTATEHFTSSDGHSRITFYDLDWNKQNIHYGEHRMDDVPKPMHLDQMIEYARILSKGFPFVRVDFFDTDEKLYLAEMTFYPGGGYSSYSGDVERNFGEKFILPSKDPLGRMYRYDLNY